MQGRLKTVLLSPEHTINTTRFDTVEDGTVLTSGKATILKRRSAHGGSRA